MKKILKLVAIATLALSIGAIATAQDAGPQGGQIQSKKHGAHMGGLKLIEKFQKEVLAGLNLTSDQQKKIDDLNKATADKIKDLRKSSKDSTDKKALADQRKDLMKSYNESMRSILTPDQFKTYHEQMKAKMQEYRDEQKKNSNGKPG